MKNLAQIEGKLGQEPTYTKLSSGKEVTRFSVAVNKRWKKGGEIKKATDWFRVEAWGHLAVPTSKLVKGESVFVQGELRTGSYKAKEGHIVPTVYIVAVNVRQVGYAIFAKDDAPEPSVPDTDEEASGPQEDEGTPF
jgi:single-strand DNA-binding protein